MTQEDETWVSEAQNTFNKDSQQYQNDQSVAQEDANQCSTAEETVRGDQATGSQFLSGDEETAQSDCSRAQSAAEQVSNDATQLSQDESNLKDAEGALTESEGGI